jgi:hypothetical protein
LKHAKAKPRALNGTREASCGVVIPAFGGSSYGDVLLRGPAERYRSHSAAATRRLVRHYDSVDLSSEDEDDSEDGGIPPQEPFPSEPTVLHEYTPD